jgi:transcriptional regulator with XRE-family HTH domain
MGGHGMNELRFLRAIRGVSQLEVSKRSGIKQCTLSLLERDYRLLRADELGKIAAALNLNQKELKRLSKHVEQR